MDATHYPDWKNFIAKLQAENITMLTYINALLSDVSERGTPYQHNYWKEAIDNDYFVRDGSGDVWVGYTKASLVDLSNPKAYSWYKEIIIQVWLVVFVCLCCLMDLLYRTCWHQASKVGCVILGSPYLWTINYGSHRILTSGTHIIQKYGDNLIRRPLPRPKRGG